MEHFYFLIGLGVLVLLAFAWSLSKSLKGGTESHYILDDALFSPSQRALLAVLERAFGQEYRIHGKVRVADVIGPPPRLSRRDQERAYERLGERCLDFLICDRESTAILCAVDLAPRSRQRRPTGKDRLERICAAAGLPLVTVPESRGYVLDEIEERIRAVMRSSGIRPGLDEISMDEAASMLRGLTRVIIDEQPASRPPHRATVARPRTLASVTRPPTAPRAMPRKEPVIQAHHVLDDEPLFRIGTDVEDDRPMRAKRS